MATILIADDDADIRLALEMLLSAQHHQVIESEDAKSTVIKANQAKPDIILLDMNFTRDTTSGQEGLALLTQLAPLNIPVILMTAWSSVELAVNGLKQGAVDFVEKPWNKHQLLNSIEQQLDKAKLQANNQGYRALLAPNANSPWICDSSAMQQLETLVTQIAPTDANILILGENGTGKSLLAERIHGLSARATGPLINVNMAAIAENLFESELFGHQKGAFTDAKQHRSGRFTLADGGTLFMDEIGTLPLNLQPKLLRVLETGQFEVLGSSQTQTSNVRLISATNADLANMVTQGQFRQDLLYRLNTLVITLPPLRSRTDDIKGLANHFIDKFAQKYQKQAPSINNQAIDKLKQYPWPGNIRQLSHTIERAVLLATTNTITPEQLLLEPLPSGDIPSSNDSNLLPLQTLEQAEKQLIEQALDSHNNQVMEAAKVLGISRNALYRRMEKYGIVDE